MKWKYQIGKYLHHAETGLLKLNSNFVRKNFPYGRNWMFDVKRIFNTQPVTIVDAGANVGSISLELSYWFPEAAIYAFEPIKSTFAQLVKNTSAKAKIYPFQLALGSNNEAVVILLNAEHTINSLKITQQHQNTIGKEEINMIRLDQFLKNQHLNHIDLLKIDVEGFEFEVLAGCGTLITDHIKCIYLEVSYEREAAKVHFADVEQYMEKNGFVLCGIYETRRNLYDKRRLWYSNNLYIKKSLLN